MMPALSEFDSLEAAHSFHNRTLQSVLSLVLLGVALFHNLSISSSIMGLANLDKVSLSIPK